jgi:hypothetical protein
VARRRRATPFWAEAGEAGGGGGQETERVGEGERSGALTGGTDGSTVTTVPGGNAADERGPSGSGRGRGAGH